MLSLSADDVTTEVKYLLTTSTNTLKSQHGILGGVVGSVNCDWSVNKRTAADWPILSHSHHTSVLLHLTAALNKRIVMVTSVDTTRFLCLKTPGYNLYSAACVLRLDPSSACFIKFKYCVENRPIIVCL